ncbi:MAG: hypothetical protein QRY72_03860 [Candidatus Rhabdochlamydia sp.]
MAIDQIKNISISSMYNCITSPLSLISKAIPSGVKGVFHSFPIYFKIGGVEKFWVKPIIWLGKYLKAEAVNRNPEFAQLVVTAKAVKSFIEVPKSLSGISVALKEITSPIKEGGETCKVSVRGQNKNFSYNSKEVLFRKASGIAMGVVSAISLLQFAKKQGFISKENIQLSKLSANPGNLFANLDLVTSLWKSYNKGLILSRMVKDEGSFSSKDYIFVLSDLSVEVSKLGISMIKRFGDKRYPSLDRLQMYFDTVGVFLPIIQNVADSYMKAS